MHSKCGTRHRTAKLKRMPAHNAENHHTETCTITNSAQFWCAICHKTGHRVASNECPLPGETKQTQIKSNQPLVRLLPTQPTVVVDNHPTFTTVNALQANYTRWAGKVTQHNYWPPAKQALKNPTAGPSNTHRRGLQQQTIIQSFNAGSHTQTNTETATNDNTNSATPLCSPTHGQ